jgi:hypothetical protein
MVDLYNREIFFIRLYVHLNRLQSAACLLRLSKPLRGDSLKSIFIFSFVFLDFCAGAPQILVISMSSGGIFGHYWDTLSDKLISKSFCLLYHIITMEHVCLLQRNSYVCLKIDRSNPMDHGQFSLVIDCMRRDDNTI